jgi:hypothetical protein
MGIRKLINGILQLGAESTATTQATAVIQSTSGSLALVPSGSGAITAAIPDGTAVGGNARGQYAVDLQSKRAFAASVAVGNYSVIVGGSGNQSAGAHSFAGGNDSSASGQYSFAYGNTNSASGQASVVFGQSNNASSNFSTVSGGQANTASTNTHATVVGGASNTASGQHSIAGGNSNTASGAKSVALGDSNVAPGTFGCVAIGYLNTSTDRSVALGYNNTVSALGSLVVGAQNAITSAAQFSLVSGNFGTAYLRGQVVSAPCNFGNSNLTTKGDIQQSTITAYKQDTLTTAATSSLSLDGTGTTNLIIANGANRTWNTTVKWVATVTGSSGTTTGVSIGDSIYGVSEFGFKVSASIASITPLIRDSIVADTTTMETCTMTYATGSTAKELRLTLTAPIFTGSGSLGIRTVAKIELVELGW